MNVEINLTHAQIWSKLWSFMTSKELGFFNPSHDLKKKKHPRCKRVMLPTKVQSWWVCFFIRNLGSSLASNYHLLINDVTIDGHIFGVWQLPETRTNSWQLSGRFLGLITVVLTKEHETRFWYKLQNFWLPVLYQHFHENQLVFKNNWIQWVFFILTYFLQRNQHLWF
jgi:hypothetical protein